MKSKAYYLVLPVILFLTVSCSEATTTRAAQQEKSAGTTLAPTVADTAGLAVATFAGGCFWCTEGYFERLEGIEDVVSGYTGGTKPQPTYEEVSSGTSGYAEAVQIYYDPQKTSYRDLLEAFFMSHDPTTLNRQGPDVGTQYRSAIYYHTPEQKQQTEQYITQLGLKASFKNQIVTEVQPFDKFWVAEEYHQDYYKRNPDNPYIENVAKPKVKKFEEQFQSKLKPTYQKQ